MSIYKERPKGEYNTYLALDPTGKPYVGYCKGAYKKRFNSGHGYGHNLEFQAAIEEYGADNIRVWLVAKDTTIELAADVFEPWWVKKCNAMRPHGYNASSGGRRGFTWCQETRERIGVALSKAVDQIDPETGVILYTWPSMTAASNATGISLSGISEAAHGIQKTAGGYKWQLTE